MRLKKEVNAPVTRDAIAIGLIATLGIMFAIPLGMMCLEGMRDYTPQSGASSTPTLEPIKIDGNATLGDTANDLAPTRTTLGVGWIPHQDRISTIYNDYGAWIGCKASNYIYGWAVRKKDGWSFACGRAEDVPAHCPGTDGGLVLCSLNEFPDRLPGDPAVPEFRDPLYIVTPNSLLHVEGDLTVRGKIIVNGVELKP